MAAGHSPCLPQETLSNSGEGFHAQGPPQRSAIALASPVGTKAGATAMDDQIGRVLEALHKKKMRENTLVIFHSDNGGTKNKMFAGEGDMSKVIIPCDNGLIAMGKHHSMKAAHGLRTRQLARPCQGWQHGDRNDACR
jgi:sulfatase-like protein